MATNWKWTRDDMPLGWGETNVFTAMLEYTYVSGSTEYSYLIDKVYAANVDKGESSTNSTMTRAGGHWPG